MIKSILVPATGGNADAGLFASALVVARQFAAHLEFLHVRVNAAAMATTMASDGTGATMITGLVDRIEAEANQREEKAKQMFQGFCSREGVPIGDAAALQPGPSAQWNREIGDERYWIAK